MAEPTSDLRYLPSTPAPKRSSPNVSGGWMVMLLSGLVAAVAFLYVTNQGTQRFTVLAAADDIAPGTVINEDSFIVVQANVPQAQLDRLVTNGDKRQYIGYITSAPIAQGDLITKSELTPPAAANGLRSMSIPVDKTHAVNGSLHTGDRVDIIDPTTAQGYVVQNIEVLAVNDNGGGGALGAGGAFSVTVAVNADQAVAVSNAVKNGKFDIVRSTGATPAVAGNTAPTTGGGAGNGNA